MKTARVVLLLLCAGCREPAAPAKAPAAQAEAGFGRKDARSLELGTFEVTSDQLVAGDPCYPLEGQDPYRIAKPARRGTWKASVIRIDAGGWGPRNAELFVVHAAATGDRTWQKQPDALGVDSGQLGVFDRPHYADEKLVPKDHAWRDRPIDPTQRWYSLCCEQTLSKDGAGVVPFGAVSSSGVGDGAYDWFVWIEKGEVVGIKVLFLAE